MFKIGISSTPRIVQVDMTEVQKTPAEQNVEQQIAASAPKTISNNSFRAESMFAAAAMRAQLTQQLANNNAAPINSESLKSLTPIDRQEALTAAEAQQQITNPPITPSYQEPLNRMEIIGTPLPKTLFTGDGDDRVEIKSGEGYGDNQLIHVNVNGKEAWQGTRKEFQALTIDTGKGNDVVTNSVARANIATGDGDDVVMNLRTSISSWYDGSTIETGAGNDVVINDADQAIINTGEGSDQVVSRGDYVRIDTDTGNDQVQVSGHDIDVLTASGNDSVSADGYRNNILTGSGDDDVRLSDGSRHNRVDLGDGNDFIDLPGGTRLNRVETGEGEDRVENKGVWNDVDGSGNPWDFY